MHERDLRALLLVRAVEATDADGVVIARADREAATRETLRAERHREVLRADGTLTPDGARLLVQRAERLIPGLIARHPALEKVLDRRLGSHWLRAAVPVVGLMLGVGLSALDESRRINLIAFPLLGLILWNLAIYLVLIVARISRRRGSASLAWPGRWLDRWQSRRFARLRSRIGQIHAPLGAALEQFGRDWRPAAGAILVSSGRALMHLTAACVAVGLIAGMYVRGLVFHYDAGWESTFLGPGGVARLLGAIYGPASALTGITLPGSSAEVAVLEWRAGHDGVNAAPWIHLIAVTAVLYVVLPRLVLAGVATLERLRRERDARVPRDLEAYARRALGAAGGHASGLRTMVACYAYELDSRRQEGLTRLIRLAFGPASTVEFAVPIRYGDEDEYAATASAAPGTLEGCLVGVMTLAATPESENHGMVLTSWRDSVLRASGSARLLFVVDEGPYLERIGGDASLTPRVEERRALWRAFASACGVGLLSTDLGAVERDAAANATTIAALNSALWPAESG